jgi:hypothetical protein
VRRTSVIRDRRDAGWLIYGHEVVSSREHSYGSALLDGKDSGDLDDVAFTNGLVIAHNALAPHEDAALDDRSWIRARVREHVSDHAACARGNHIALHRLHRLESLSHAFHDSAVPVDS